MTPFLSFYTPTYKRPQGLARCLASVAGQTAVADIEQVIIADHVGIGIDGMYARVPQYVDAIHGRYVHVLADDDVLAGAGVVAHVRDFVGESSPAIVLVNVQKGPLVVAPPSWPPVEGAIDLGSMIVRADVWRAHAHDWGKRYEGDFDFAAALHRAGHEAVYCPILFLYGGQSHGAAEAA